MYTRSKSESMLPKNSTQNSTKKNIISFHKLMLMDFVTKKLYFRIIIKITNFYSRFLEEKNNIIWKAEIRVNPQETAKKYQNRPII